MYKKAGIVIAIILVAAGILVLSISSCNKDGGIQVKPATDTVESRGGAEDIDDIEEESIIIKKENKGEDSSDGYVSELSYIGESSVEPIIDESEIVKHYETESKVESSIDKRESRAELSEVETDSSKDEQIEVSTDKTDSSKAESLTEEEQSALAELKNYKERKESSAESSEQTEKEVEQSSESSTDVSTGGLEYKEINASDLPKEKQSKTVFGIIRGKEMLVEGGNIFTTIIILDENSDTYRYFVPMSAYESLEKGTKLEVSITVYFDEGKSIKQVTGVSVAEWMLSSV